MALWDAPLNAVRSFFGGNNQKKKKDEEQQVKRVVSAPVPKNPNTPNNGINLKQPKNAFNSGAVALTLPGSKPTGIPLSPSVTSAPKPQTPRSIEEDLNARTEKNYADSLKQTEQGQGWFDKGVNFFTKDNERIARQNARNRAVSQYQEEHNYNPADKPAVTQFIGNTRNMGEETSKRIQGRMNTIDKTLRKTSEIPVVSDFVTMGSSGANLIYKHLGDEGLARDAHDNWTKTTLGMSDAEVAQLPKEQQDRLRKLQMGLSVASPVMSALDIASLGEAGAAIGGLKSAAATGGKQAVVQSGKQVLKSTGKNAVIAGVSAPVVAAPIENYINNGNALDFHGYDVKNIPRQAGTAALWSLLLPGAARGKDAESVDIGADAKTVALRDGLEQAAEEARLANTEAQNVGRGRRIEVKQPRDIPVGGEDVPGVDIPVANNNPSREGTPIREVSGDTPGVNQVRVPTADEVAAGRFADQPVARPDSSIEGINSPSRVITKADKAQAQQTLDDMLASGKVTDEQHKQLTEDLTKIIAQDETAPKGQPIKVQEIKSIPVEDQTVVPTDAGAPGTVRATNAVDPNAIRTEAAASAPVTPARPTITPETQAILDNPKRFSKAQVAAARNQLKLAKAYAKTQEGIAEQMSRIETASPAAQSGEGFVPTGEFAKGQNGNAYQKTNRRAEMEQAVNETANMSPADVIKTAQTNASTNGAYNRRDIRNIAALFETKRLERGTPEYEAARQILKEDGTNWGQTGALRNYTIRRTASPEELISRFESKIYRLAEDPSKIDSRLFDEIDAAENNFTATRDAALQAYNRFTEAPTKENAKAYHAAQDAADKADRDVKMTEYKVASKALKGNKDIAQARELEKMAQTADMYQMDAVDASMLSGTGTFTRNLFNATVGSVEEKLFGKMGARLASLTPKSRKNEISVGGGTGVRGLSEGVSNIVDSSKARAGEAGINPLEHIKNWATTGNQLGDALIDTQTANNVRDHYTQMLKSQGYKGAELKNRASVMARQDPDNVTHTYQTAARVAAGLGSGITRNNKIETTVKNIISDAISGGKPNRVSEGTAKLVTRMTLGFPTAIGRSLAEGGKRFTLGAPTFLKALRESDPQTRAILVKEGIKQAGTGGLVIPPLFYALGASGAITGSYPEDQAERDRWAREGIVENAVKIDGHYYQLPGYLGAWAMPGLFYASLGRNDGDFSKAAADTAKIVPALLPTDQLNNWNDVINGRADAGKFFTQTAASAVRAATPGGALLNEIGKMFDPTQNDTNSGTVWENFVDKVMNGIPGAANTLTNKTDEAGNELRNPSPYALALGASGAEQGKGVERTNEINTQTNSALQEMADAGAFGDPNLKAVITDDKVKKIYQDILDGKQVNPDQLKKVQDAMVKGVTASDDTAYLEKEQYDTNIAALTIKKQLMAADPTTKPSDLKKMDIQIARGKVFRDGEIPYSDIQMYESTNLSDWRAMGDPEDDSYDPETYQKLWAIDEALAKVGGSYKEGHPDKQKYSAKESKARGRGGNAASTLSSDFGKLGELTGAPKVKQYDSIDQRSGAVPIINVQRPNIVHKVGFSG